MKILTTAQMRQLEDSCAEDGLTTEVLMENAGRAVAAAVKRIMGDISQKQILLLIGPGNNGGDGLVAARHLHDLGAKVIVYLFGDRPTRDPQLKPIRDRRITRIDSAKDDDLDTLSELVNSVDAVIDAIFGTGVATSGKSRPFGGLLVMILDKVKKAKKKRSGLRLIALDLPSGLNADTGDVDPACLQVDNTITLAFPKPGLFKFPGVEKVGELTVVDIGLPGYIDEGKEGREVEEVGAGGGGEAGAGYIGDAWAKALLPERPSQANKGSFGRVLVVAGSMNYVGAAYLACSGAMRVGAGVVTLATTGRLQSILASKLTEVTYLPLPESRPGTLSPESARVIFRQAAQQYYNVLLLGCGMGQSEATAKLIRTILLAKGRPPLPSLILDADALNILAVTPGWWQRLTEDAILTPHPGEMARLVGISSDEVQKDRVSIAKRVAAEWKKTVVLKGAYTVVAAPDGRTQVSNVANAGLASAGTGDVLAGAIAGLLAQGLSLFDAAACGVYLHGMAGEMVSDRLGDAGMIASDLLVALPQVIKQLKESESAPIAE
ncbi:MAG TPA: NAD(P)H-hydrate dehydratase [Dehalococcoidia bacterium]|nr:NAD(P)H-hydrate dehydratase [Dehalococcoidia bacterium]